MKPMSLFLLAVCLLAVQAQDFAQRTFGFAHNHPAQLQAHDVYKISAQAQGPSNHALPAHHGSHAGHVHQSYGHVHHGQVLNAHQHPVGHGHQHNNHEHSAATHSAAASIAWKVNTVPVLMCRVVKVPVNTVPAAPSTSNSGSSGTQHVGSHIATSISHVFGRVVNPVVALLQNASVWLNRTTPQNPNATSLQHSSAVPHTAVIKKLAFIEKLGHQPMSTASVPARPVVLTREPSLEPAVTSTVAEATTRYRSTTKLSTLAPVVVSTLGAPAPTLSALVRRAGTSPNSRSPIASADPPASVREVPSATHISVQVADTTAPISESALPITTASSRATFSVGTPPNTVGTTTSTLGSLDPRASPFPARTTTISNLPASLQEVSTTSAPVDNAAPVSESAFASTAATVTTTRVRLSTVDLTSTVPTTTVGFLDPRADPFTALLTSMDVSTFRPVHWELENTTSKTSVVTSAPSPLFVEASTWKVPASAPKDRAASTFPATTDSAYGRFAQFTTARTSAETSTPPSAVTPTVIATRAPPTMTTPTDVAAPVTPSITLPAVALSPTSAPAFPQPARSTVLDVRSVRPKTR